MPLTQCPNCQAERNGNFCPRCGQNDRDYRRGLRPMLGQLLSEAFELDGRMVRTMRGLLFKPGLLSAEFSANRRADYVSPIRLYLFASILFFACMSLTTEPIPLNVAVEPEQRMLDPSTEVSSEQIERMRITLPADLQVGLDTILARNDSWTRAALLAYIKTLDQSDVSEFLIQPFIQRQIIRGLINPDQALDQFIEQLPIALFLLLPAYALLLKVFYIRQQKYFVEHLVFALHLHAFAFLIFTLLAIIPDDQQGVLQSVESALYLVFAIYYFMALRRYYRQGRAMTFIKYSVLISAYSVLILPAMVLVMATTFATY